MTTIAAPAATSSALLSPGRTLRLEGALLFMAAVAAYAHSGAGWWLFAGLLLVPDVGMLGYAAGARVGAFTYNLTHTLALPLGLALAGLWSGSSTTIAVALVWAAHIGMDRALGYGLKYPTHFGDTHLQRVR